MFQSRFISIKNRNLCNKKWGVESLRPDRWFGRSIVFVHTDKIQNTSYMIDDVMNESLLKLDEAIADIKEIKHMIFI